MLANIKMLAKIKQGWGVQVFWVFFLILVAVRPFLQLMNSKSGQQFYYLCLDVAVSWEQVLDMLQLHGCPQRSHFP